MCVYSKSVITYNVGHTTGDFHYLATFVNGLLWWHFKGMEILQCFLLITCLFDHHLVIHMVIYFLYAEWNMVIFGNISMGSFSYPWPIFFIWSTIGMMIYTSILNKHAYIWGWPIEMFCSFHFLYPWQGFFMHQAHGNSENTVYHSPSCRLTVSLNAWSRAWQPSGLLLALSLNAACCRILLEACEKVASDFDVRRCHFPGTPVTPARGMRESYQWLCCEAMSFPGYASFPCSRQARKLPVTLMWGGVISRVRQFPLLEASEKVASDFNVRRCHFPGTPVSPAWGMPECCQWLSCEAVSFPGYASFPCSRQARKLPVTLMLGSVISRVRQFPLLDASQNVVSDFNVRRCHFPGTPVSPARGQPECCQWL